MTVSRYGGVAYDLKESPYIVTVHDVTFFFSTALGMRKFARDRQKQEDWLCDSLSRRFHFDIDARLLACMQLYERIQSRGFYIEYGGEGYTCREEVLLAGMRIRRGCSATQCPDTTDEFASSTGTQG